MQASHHLELDVSDDNTSKAGRPWQHHPADGTSQRPISNQPTKEFSFMTRDTSGFNTSALGGKDYNLDYVASRMVNSDALTGEKMLQRPLKQPDDWEQLYTWSPSKGTLCSKLSNSSCEMAYFYFICLL